jgi:hypothetical protein
MENNNTGGYLGLPSERADLLDKIQPGNIIEIVRHRLLGEVEINGVWTPTPELQSRAISKKGAWDISTLMLPVSSQNVSLSSLKDNEIRARSLNIAKTAQCMCLRNWKEYNINGIDQLKFVHEIVFSNTFITLKQPQNAGIQNLIKNIAGGDIGYNDEERGGMSLFRPK